MTTQALPASLTAPASLRQTPPATKQRRLGVVAIVAVTRARKCLVFRRGVIAQPEAMDMVEQPRRDEPRLARESQPYAS